MLDMTNSAIHRIAILCGFFVVISVLVSCTVEPSSQAMLDAYRVLRTDGGSSQDAKALNPNFKYLRVVTGGREVLMVLGYVDQTTEGPVEVWYSGEADVLRLRDGRVIGATMKRGVNWLAVSFSHLPNWEAVGKESMFERVRDESPGYRYGISEKLLLRPIASPSDSQLKNISPASLAWFDETVQVKADLPPARYAVKSDGAAHQVIYAEQCLSAEFCFSWQVWPFSSKGTH
jgi:hypothetical protein